MFAGKHIWFGVFLLLASCVILPTWLNLFLPETLRKLDLLQPSGSFKLRGIGLTVKEAQQKKQMIPRPQTRQHLDKL